MQTLPAEVPIGNKGDLLVVKANLWLVEHGVVFNLTTPPSMSRSPKNQNGTMTKDALLMENFISAEFLRPIRKGVRVEWTGRIRWLAFL